MCRMAESKPGFLRPCASLKFRVCVVWARSNHSTGGHVFGVSLVSNVSPLYPAKTDEYDLCRMFFRRLKDRCNVIAAAIMTVTKMPESLPESVQERGIERLREYLADLQDELKWDSLFEQTQSQLVTAARRAKQDIVQGRAQPMDDEQL